jgi:CheY-like chemotaxis protein
LPTERLWLGEGHRGCITSRPRSVSQYRFDGIPRSSPEGYGVLGSTTVAKRVLIADDSRTVRYVIRLFLENRRGLEVCGEASNGLEAIEKAEALKPNLILLDYSMPELNGAEVGSILKKRMPDVPIILFTLYGENVGKAIAATTGIDVVLCKPDGITQLAETAQKILAES